MFSRYLVIVLSIGATLYRVSQGAWVEASGLGALAAGLVLLQLAVRRPALKPIAWAAFGVTVVSMAVVFFRMRAAG